MTASVHEAEARVSALLQASPVILYTMDPADLGTMTWVSGNFARIAGWDPETIRDNPSWLVENVQADDHARLLTRVEEWLAGGAREPVTLLYRQRTPDGHWRWYEDQLSANRSETGTITELVGSIQDVTERVAKERRMGKIAVNLPAVLYQFRIGPDGRMSFPYASAGIERIYGVSAETVMSDAEPVFEALHPDDRPSVEASIADSQERLEPWRARYRVRHPRIGTLWVEGHATPEVEADGGTMWHGAIFDISERMQAEQERDRVLAILEASPEYIGLADLEGNVLYQNPALRGLIGDLDGAEENRPFIRAHPDWAARKLVEEALPAAARDGTWQGETALDAADGRTVPIAQTVVAHRGPDGQVERFSTIMRDISDRKAAERDRDRLLSILEATPDFISMAKANGELTYVNRGGLEIMGLDSERNGLERPLPDAIAGDRAGYLAHPEWASRLIREEGIPAAAEHGVWQGETAYIDHTGREVPASQVILSHHDENGALDRFSTILRDISEQRRLEEGLRAEKVFSDAILRNLPGVFYMLDADGRFRRWNEQFERVTGYPGDDLTRVSPLALFPEDEQVEVDTRIRQVFEDGSAELEAHLCHRDGSCSAYYLTGYRVELADGAYLLGVGLDIDELEEVKQELERSNVELEQFAYAVSHDLQEPLRIINSYLNLLVRRLEGALGDREQRYIDAVTQGADRMARMIQGLLEYSRIKRMGDPMGPVALDDVVADARANLETAEAESGARITVAPLPVVSGDAGQLVRLFQNLLGNAIKYGPPDATPEICVEAERVDDHWRIRVHDNGIGIEPDQNERVFQVFQRLHGREEYEGTGIGMALAQRIVERHGGTIGVASGGSGKGSTFWFTLPASGGVE